MDDALAVVFLAALLPLIELLVAAGQYRVVQPSQLVCRRRHGLGSVHARAQLSEVRPQRRLARAQCRNSLRARLRHFLPFAS